MALSHEDKKDVSRAYGKALANKVSKVTRDNKRSAHGINAERRRQGYKPMSAERNRIHEGLDKYL